MEGSPDIQNSDAQIEVVEGPEILNRMSEAELFEVADRFGEESYEAPNIIAQSMRMKLRTSLLEPLGKKIEGKYHLGKYSQHFGRFTESVHPENTLKNNKEYQRERILKNISANNTVAVFVNGELGAIGSIEEYEKPAADGRKVLEVGQAYTMKKFRGQKLAFRIWVTQFMKARNEHPDALIVAHSKHPKVIETCEANGFKTMDVRQRNALLGRDWSEKLTNERDRHWKKLGLHFFAFDPKEHSGN